MGEIKDAKTLQEVSDAAMTMLTSSLEAYRKVQLSAYESLTGAKPLDSEVCAKNFQTWMGTMAKDMGNLQTVWAKAMEVMEPKPQGQQPNQ